MSSTSKILWHTLTAVQTIEDLGSDAERGLTQTEANQRLARQGPNEIPEGRRRTPWHMFLAQFRDVLILVLLVAAGVAGLIGELRDSIVILVIVVLNAVIGAVQEYRAERALAALRRMAAPSARLRRDGEVRTVPSRDLVPGDIVLLEPGDVVPADLRLLESVGLQADEAALTGESVAVEKTEDPLEAADLPLGDRLNMAYKGTNITRGRAAAVVVATGLDTELGGIASLLTGTEVLRTPLQQRLARFSRLLALAILAIVTVIFAFGLMRGEELVLMFLTAVSLAVAAIPEALPAVITISLALGARKMARHHALIRRLPAVETLGSVTWICSDKTGTLTRNEMRLETIVAGRERLDHLGDLDDESGLHQRLGQALSLCTDVTRDGDYQLTGDPTEIALYLAARDAGYHKHELESLHPRVGELAFHADRRAMTTLHNTADGVVAFVKGAPEALLPRCVRQLTPEGETEFDERATLSQAQDLAEEGYRVLALAFREFDTLPEPLEPERIETELTFLGLAGLIDPPREEVPQAIDDCKSAGIVPVMITGDHPGTARAIASRLGIARDGDGVLTGKDIEQLSETELADRAETTFVYARVNPEQKINIVKALQSRGQFVAMTGDGVNDAPALKRADIGVAMGQKGTDVARGASDMILLDDNFATIVRAIREGRRVFDNIRKFIKDTMSSNSGEIWTLFLAPFFGLPIPLLPIQILWINLVTDGLPGLAFTAEPAERGILQRPPRPPDESIFAHGMWQHIIWVGLFVGGISIASQAWAISRGVEYWQTVVFTVLTISQLFHSLSVRSETQSLFVIGLFSNLAMLGAVVLTLILQLAIIYVPALNMVFHTQPLPLPDLLLCLALSSLVLFAVEIEKWLARRGMIYREPAGRTARPA